MTKKATKTIAHRRGLRFTAGDQIPATGDRVTDLTKEVMRQTRSIAALERQRNKKKREITALTKEIRARKRGLRMLVNRKQFIENPEEIEFDSEVLRVREHLPGQNPIDAIGKAPKGKR